MHKRFASWRPSYADVGGVGFSLVEDRIYKVSHIADIASQ